ncbi:moesin/ezrin/radixin homolog 1-like isoform X1 [Palaemon carinicauda]|uniref:moesin/ezrin/radixin homolog 1-like isoform X1 n=1 Tax=Palaemon carinicauda TaxID=392227 RepID=UPI0035B68C42
MGKYQVRVHTFLQDVETAIDKKTIGRQLVLEVADIISVKPTYFFSLQYDTKDGKRKFLSLEKPILDHKIDTRHAFLQLYLRLRVQPTNPADIKEENTKLIIYREIKQAIETGELNCSGKIHDDLSHFSKHERIEDYLNTVSKNVEGYGIMKYNMKRDDGYPVLLSVDVRGVSIRAGTEESEIPFSKMKQVARGRKSVTLMPLAPAAEVKLQGSDSSFAKEVQETIMVNYYVHKQLLGTI